MKPSKYMMRAVMVALELALVWVVAQSLWTGRIPLKDHPVERALDPFTYWVELAVITFAIITLPLWMLYRERQER
ncbi:MULTISPECIES: hypothetical protein [unclassified Mesorhizobium]|uniref:hypothetical protein n=1 Tax=unclassified Mesorhizobium TaxID=325217 RepID=UPI000FC9A3B1|nr:MULTISPECIES: hypothetical protein [unclassified Mesorhizobium]RUW68133.1 hypothetical protein EOA31_26780 [Mesorhizobium sp. M4B.F.Ca.ET.049.02.1.2]RVD26654.1 hypothetical protein EN738_12645 [Mesorhizobium sp. M4B.F.Ca.ET.017.02.2.1]TGV24350.1 hypothetical protein EN786_21265 [Mesorhizobium sp. M4B.F.Ca.ET.143.01.1.1]